jgi:hypothetical protein
MGREGRSQAESENLGSLQGMVPCTLSSILSYKYSLTGPASKAGSQVPGDCQVFGACPAFRIFIVELAPAHVFSHVISAPFRHFRHVPFYVKNPR